jgi:HEAT repeat protein
MNAWRAWVRRSDGWRASVRQPGVWAAFVAVLVGMGAYWPGIPLVPPGPALSGDELILKDVHLASTGPGLLDFFRKRTATEIDPAKVKELITRLSDKSAATREPAFGELVCYGAAAVGALRQAANNLDELEAAALARKCLESVEGTGSASVVKAAARQLQQIQPAGALEVLLDYLPFADDDGVIEEIQDVLVALALPQGKPAEALLQALKHPVPIRRAIAAESLCKAGGSGLHERIIGLLKDPKPFVRLRTALGMARNQDVRAIPVLIDLLAELPPAQRKRAEDFLTELAGEWAIAVPPRNEDTLGKLRRDSWAAWWKSTAQTDLLNELRKRTLSDADRERVLGLIGQLGDSQLEIREKAAADLMITGLKAAPLLHQAVHNDNPKIRLYAEKCLQLMEKDGTSVLPLAALRLVALHKPAGATETLLRYVPFAETDAITEELKLALGTVGFSQGKPDRALLQALEDKVGLRRSIAAETLCRSGSKELRQALYPLLKDPDPLVRQRTALALAQGREKQAIPVLIDILTEVSPDLAWKAEDFLLQLAGNKSPEFPKDNSSEARKKWREAWAAWWSKNGEAIDLAQVRQGDRMLGLTLVVGQYDNSRRSTRVYEIDQAGKVRWQIDGLQFALDAQVLPGDRVLMVEANTGRVTERDFKGNVVWEKMIPNCFLCKRLPNGTTFVACRHQLVETDRNGNDNIRHNRPQQDIASAKRLRDGQLVYITYSGQYVRLDSSGKEIKNQQLSFLVSNNFNFTHSVEFLPNDHFLVPLNNTNKLVEYNLDGKIIWEANVQTPGLASVLPNGHILVPSMGDRILELNRSGKTVTEIKQEGRIYRVHRR